MTRFAGVWAMAQGVAVQADGKIVAAGFTGMSHYSLDVVVVRYTTAGTLDTTFGRGGKVVTDFVDDGETASAVAIQRDGRIVVAGRSGLGGCALLRYTNAGLLDRSFGTGGRVVTDLAGNGLAYALAIQRDGKIVVAGQRWVDESEFAVARFTIDGRLDRTFGSGGGVLTGIRGYDVPDEIAVQPDGKIVVAGSAADAGTQEHADFALVRYTPSGKLDPGFGTGGKVVTDLSGGDDGAFALAIQKDGKIVAAGSSGGLENHDLAITRYTTAGKLDASFGRSGKVLTNLGGNMDAAWTVAVQPDGKIDAAGDSRANFALVRYTTGGRLDPTFGRAGQVITDFGGGDSLSDITLQKDGKIVAAGNSGDDFALARYTK